MLGRPQIVSDFELRALFPQAAIADVGGVAARISVALGDNGETGRGEPDRQPSRQVDVEAADEYPRVSHATMHADDNVAARRHGEALGMIEAVTGDVQVPIPAIRFEAFETKQAVIRTCDQRGDLGGSLFDLAAMGREDDCPGAGTLDPSDAKIPSLRLMLRKFPE